MIREPITNWIRSRRSPLARRIWLQLKRCQIYLGEELSYRERERLRTLTRYIGRGQTVLDIGAYIGLWAGRFGSIVGPNPGRVLAFEAIPETFQELQELWKKCPNIETYNIALSDQDATIEFLVPRAPSGLSTAAVASTADQLAKTVQAYTLVLVPARRLDGLVSELNLSQVSLIKCDVEGHELQVMVGAQTLLKDQRPVVYLEVLREKWVTGNPLRSDVVCFLQSMGYSVWQIKAGRVVPPEEFEREIEDFLFLP